MPPPADRIAADLLSVASDPSQLPSADPADWVAGSDTERALRCFQDGFGASVVVTKLAAPIHRRSCSCSVCSGRNTPVKERK